MMRTLSRFGVVALVWAVVAFPASPALSQAAEGDDAPEPVTTSDPTIEADELALLLVPLTKEELLIEAGGWQEIVKAKAQEIARAEIAVMRQNKEIEQADEIEAKAEEASAQLQEAAEKAAAAKASGDEDAAAEAAEALEEARELIDAVESAADESVDAARKTEEMRRALSDAADPADDKTTDAAQQAKAAVAEIEETIGDTADQASPRVSQGQQVEAEAAADQAAALAAAKAATEAAEEAKQAEKVELLEKVTTLREERTRLLDNLRAVIDELERKTDTDDADTLAAVKDFRRYISTVSGIHVDVTDTTSAWVSLKGWATSQEGGMRWLINLGSFLGILVAAWFASRLLSGLAGKAFSRVDLPMLLEDFLIKSVRWVVMIVGGIWALSALEISVGPLLALVGAAGFILAFAMQDSLSNFASGMMILFFRPFDTGDVVDAGGVSGTVNSMNLVATTIKTFDNKLMVVPNSKIWSDVITNATGVNQRRVDMEFGIGYDDDIDLAQQILEEIVTQHPKVMEDPAPLIRMHVLGDSSVNFICRPWATPADYWEVYWDVTKAVKKRFDEAGIGIPFPQRDVHLYIEKGHEAAPPIARTHAEHVAEPSSGTSDQPIDGGLDK